MRKSVKIVKNEKVPETASELAKLLGVERQRITKHRSKPNAPPLSDVPAWRVFLQEVSRNGVLPVKTSAALAAQRLRILTATADDKERMYKIKKAEVVEISEVNRIAQAVYSFFFGELDRQRQTWPALFKGRSELEIFGVIESEQSKIKSGLLTRLKEFIPCK